MKREIAGKPLYWHIIQWGIFFLSFFIVIFCGIRGIEDLNSFQISIPGTEFALDLHTLPFMLFGGLFGYMSVFASILIVFLAELIRDPQAAYLASIYIVAAMCFSAAGHRRAFKKRGKTILLFIVASLAQGALNALLLMIEEYRFNYEVLTGVWANVLAVLPAVALAAFFCRLFFTRFPDAVKERVALGLLYYSDEVGTAEERRFIRSKNVLGAKITMIVLVEAAVLVIAAIGATTILLPDLQRMNERRAAGEQRIDWMSKPPEKPDGETEDGVAPEPEPVEGTADEGDGPPEIPDDGDLIFAVNTDGLAYMAKLVLMLLCIAFPVAAMANFFVQLRVVVPVTHLASYMVRFARTPQSRLEEYVSEVKTLNVRTHDEIEELYHAVDRTVHDVVHYIGRVQEEQKLKEDLRIAEAASKAKSEFLSNMSHEIRTPINAVLGMDEMILRESKEEETLKYALDIKNAGNTLLGIINDILDSSKIESGKMEILPVKYELASTVNDLVNMTMQKARDKGLELRVTVDENIPHLLIGDEIRVKQCILNILTNAVKYTEKGSITLTMGYRKEDEDHIFLSVCVEDTGIGIKEEDLSKLFSPFERIEEIRNRTIEGTGLGMSIVKQLLAMMDTKLTVKSVYGEGSVFSFEVRQEVADWKPIGDFSESYRASMEEELRYTALFEAPEARILVTDDTVMNLTVIKGLLKQTKLLVDTAESGAETLEKVKQTKYDVIFLDYRMPVMDGIETLQAMQTLAGNLNLETPVIALTANAVSGARDMYLDAGFSDYLSKPIDARKLEKLLMDYLPPEKCHELSEQLTDEKTEEAPDPRLAALTGIDLSEALKNCGSQNIFLEAAENFLTALPEKAEEIERCAAAGDFRNYTVLVHALKSSARLLGAAELSAQAAYLETCGNEENAAEIKEKTPALLLLYRSYAEHLAPLRKEEDENKPEIPPEDLVEAYAGMKEFVEAFDFDSADRIMEMLSGYRIPFQEKEKYDTIKKLVSAVDRDGLMEVL